MAQQERQVVRFVMEHPGCTVDDIASEISSGKRTVYTRIKACNAALVGSAEIVFERAGEQGPGYYLRIEDKTAFDS